MRRGIGRDDLHGVAAVGKQAGVEGIGFVGQIVFQQKPARFSVAAVVDGIDELIVVLVVRIPFHADGIAIMTAGTGDSKCMPEEPLMSVPRLRPDDFWSC